MNITKTGNSITIKLDEMELNILRNDLLDPIEWIENAIRNKLANRKDALKDFWLKKFEREKSIENIPTDEVALFDLIFSQKEYKPRAVRDIEERKALGI